MGMSACSVVSPTHAVYHLYSHQLKHAQVFQGPSQGPSCGRRNPMGAEQTEWHRSAQLATTANKQIQRWSDALRGHLRPCFGHPPGACRPPPRASASAANPSGGRDWPQVTPRKSMMGHRVLIAVVMEARGAVCGAGGPRFRPCDPLPLTPAGAKSRAWGQPTEHGAVQI